jgi:hypothetical protein
MDAEAIRRERRGALVAPEACNAALAADHFLPGVAVVRGCGS